MAYAEVVRSFVQGGISFEDEARAYLELERPLRVRREPRPFQREAVAQWSKEAGRGVVVLPTGAGKSHVAVMAIAEKKRSTLIVVPTLDLVRQWFDLLRTSFGGDVGIVGGGEHSVQPLTVTTYDSAHLHMEHFGARFGLVVFDECHHLPGTELSAGSRALLGAVSPGAFRDARAGRRARRSAGAAHRTGRVSQGHRGARRQFPGGLRDGAGRASSSSPTSGTSTNASGRSTSASFAPRRSSWARLGAFKTS